MLHGNTVYAIRQTPGESIAAIDQISSKDKELSNSFEVHKKDLPEVKRDLRPLKEGCIMIQRCTRGYRRLKNGVDMRAWYVKISDLKGDEEKKMWILHTQLNSYNREGSAIKTLDEKGNELQVVEPRSVVNATVILHKELSEKGHSE